MLFLFSQIRLSSALYCTFPAKVINISRLRKKRCNIMFFFLKNISLWDFSWLFAFEYCFFLNFARTILAPTAINQ